jgi:hypothetical protein
MERAFVSSNLVHAPKRPHIRVTKHWMNVLSRIMNLEGIVPYIKALYVLPPGGTTKTYEKLTYYYTNTEDCWWGNIWSFRTAYRRNSVLKWTQSAALPTEYIKSTDCWDANLGSLAPHLAFSDRTTISILPSGRELSPKSCYSYQMKQAMAQPN